MRGDGKSARNGGITRHAALGASVAEAIAAPALAHGANRPIRMGFVSPRTGPLAAFGEADACILEGIERALAQSIRGGGRTHPVQILARDSQSNPSRAA